MDPLSGGDPILIFSTSNYGVETEDKATVLMLLDSALEQVRNGHAFKVVDLDGIHFSGQRPPDKMKVVATPSEDNSPAPLNRE